MDVVANAWAFSFVPATTYSKYKQTIGERVFHGRQKIFWQRKFKGRIYLDLKGNFMNYKEKGSLLL